MMKKRSAGILVFVFLGLSLLAECSRDNRGDQILSSPAQMNAPGYSIGVPTGAAATSAVEQKFSKCKIEYFASLHDAYLSVQNGKIDAFAFDRHAMQYMVLHQPDLALMDEKIADENIVVGAALGRDDLMSKVNAFIKQYRADGTCQDMYSRWLLGKNLKMPELPEPENPVMDLKIGTDGLNEPMNFYAGGQLTGFDIEFVKRLALFLNAKVTFQTMEFSALIIAAISGKIDLLVANLNALPERRKKMLFSDTYVDSEISFLVRKDRLPKNARGQNLDGQDIKDIGGLAGGRVGVITGTTSEFFMKEKYPQAKVGCFDNIADAVSALQGNKLDYVITAGTTAANFVQNNQDLSMLPDRLINEGAAIAVSKKNEALLKQLNAALARFRENGTLDRIVSRWIKQEGSDYGDAEIPRAAGSKVLRVAISANREPMCFVRNNGFAGLDCELIERLAQELGMRIQYSDMLFSSLIAALQSGKADVAISNMSPTAERRKQVNFTDIYFENPQVALVKKNAGPSLITSLPQLAGKKVGVLTGSSFDAVLKKKIPEAVPVYFNNFSDQTEAVKSGKLTGFLVDEPIARDIMRSTSGVTCLKLMLRSDGYAFAFSKSRTDLHRQVNAALEEMRSSGAIKKIDAKWFGSDESAKVLPDFAAKGAKGVLRFATNSSCAPFAYIKNGKIVGYDIEIAVTIAEKLGLRPEIVDMDFNAIIPSLMAGKNDMAGACIVVTEERAKSILFSTPDYTGGVVVMVAGDAAPRETVGGGSFLSDFSESFRRTFLVEDRYRLVLQGLQVTIVISILSAIFGALLGFVICMMSRSQSAWARMPAHIFIRAIQGTPIVVLLMILYYIVFGSVNINAILVAVVGFSINFAAYVSEMMRTGIAAVDKGQLEAAAALGFNRFQIFIRIIFPQAARFVLPVFKGEFISMVKMTSVVGYIAIQDLTKMSDIIRSRTYEAFFPLIATALIYFAISYCMTGLLTLVEINIDPKRRKRAVKGVAPP